MVSFSLPQKAKKARHTKVIDTEMVPENFIRNRRYKYATVRLHSIGTWSHGNGGWAGLTLRISPQPTLSWSLR